jgi:putative sterol carrier protein
MSDHEVQSILDRVADLKRRALADSYMGVAGELGDMNAFLKTALPQMPLSDASRVMQAFYPVVFEGLIELVAKDETLRQRLQNAENVSYLLDVPQVSFALCLMIQGGQFSYRFEKPEQPDVTMRTSPETLVRIMTGQTDAFEAFMEGQVEVEGSLIKARGLRAVLEAMGDTFGFRLMEFSA